MGDFMNPLLVKHCACKQYKAECSCHKGEFFCICQDVCKPTKRYEWDKAADGYLRQNYILSISGMSKKDERGTLMKELHELLLNLYPEYIGAVK